MQYEKFHALAQSHGAIYDEYGVAAASWYGGENSQVDSEVGAKCDHFHTSHLHSSFRTVDFEPQYGLLEPFPIFEDLVNFLAVISPLISAVHLLQLQMLVEYTTDQEILNNSRRFFINQHIDIQTVYDFLTNHKYC